MRAAYNAAHRTTDGTVKTGPGTLVSVVLVGGSTAATLTVYDNTAASGTILLTLTAPIDDSAIAIGLDFVFSIGCHVDIGGTGASVTVAVL